MKAIVTTLLFLLFASCGSSNSSRGTKIVDPLDPQQLEGRWKLVNCQSEEGAFYSSVVDYQEDGKVVVIEQTYDNSECLGNPITNTFYQVPYMLKSNSNNKIIIEYKYYQSIDKPKEKTLYTTTAEVYYDRELLVSKTLTEVFILPNGKFESINVQSTAVTWERI